MSNHFPGTEAHLVEINLFVHLMTNIHAHLRGVTSWQKMDKSRWLPVFFGGSSRIYTP